MTTRYGIIFTGHSDWDTAFEGMEHLERAVRAMVVAGCAEVILVDHPVSTGFHQLETWCRDNGANIKATRKDMVHTALTVGTGTDAKVVAMRMPLIVGVGVMELMFRKLEPGQMTLLGVGKPTDARILAIESAKDLPAVVDGLENGSISAKPYEISMTRTVFVFAAEETYTALQHLSGACKTTPARDGALNHFLFRHLSALITPQLAGSPLPTGALVFGGLGLMGLATLLLVWGYWAGWRVAVFLNVIGYLAYLVGTEIRTRRIEPEPPQAILVDRILMGLVALQLLFLAWRFHLFYSILGTLGVIGLGMFYVLAEMARGEGTKGGSPVIAYRFGFVPPSEGKAGQSSKEMVPWLLGIVAKLRYCLLPDCFVGLLFVFLIITIPQLWIFFASLVGLALGVLALLEKLEVLPPYSPRADDES